MNLRVGDPMVVLPDNNHSNGMATATVAIVGRKWFTIMQWGRQRRFDLVTGREQGDGCGGYCYAVTPDQATALALKHAAMERLSNLTRGFSWQHPLSVADADAISTIIEAANERAKEPTTP